jgi:alpha-tubulin suppressor-like RCC1 family protein
METISELPISSSDTDTTFSSFYATNDIQELQDIDNSEDIESLRLQEMNEYKLLIDDEKYEDTDFEYHFMNDLMGISTKPVNISKNFENNKNKKTKIQKISVGENHILALDIRGDIWSWGGNKYGECGLGLRCIRLPNPRNIKGNFPEQTKFKEIVASKYCSFAIDTHDEVWCWGFNKYSQLGFRHKDFHTIKIPKKLNIGKVESIVSSNYLTYIISKTGRVLVSGKTDFTSSMHEESVLLDITDKFGKTKIAKIFTNCNVSFAIDENKNTWCWGNNNYKQLLQNNNTFASHFTKNPINITNNFVTKNENGETELLNIEKIECGYSFCLALDDRGSLWMWGDNTYTEIILGFKNDTQNRPINISNFFPETWKFRDISCGNFSCLALDDCNQVWVWGENEFGKLGNRRPNVFVKTPENISSYFRANTQANTQTDIEINITSVKSSCSNFTVFLETNGDTWTCGDNILGQLGSFDLEVEWNLKNKICEKYSLEQSLKIYFGNNRDFDYNDFENKIPVEIKEMILENINVSLPSKKEIVKFYKNMFVEKIKRSGRNLLQTELEQNLNKIDEDDVFSWYLFLLYDNITQDDYNEIRLYIENRINPIFWNNHQKKILNIQEEKILHGLEKDKYYLVYGFEYINKKIYNYIEKIIGEI